ncbi:MAG TPA: isoleucine--tRNA ligase [Candidatus Dormibacteraeota bacterium]
MPRFAPVSSRANLADGERDVLGFWKQARIFERSLAQREGAPLFVFYEGPPTANGRPGLHHVLARAFKDLFPRYKQMCGHQVPRKGGWDTHGLPVELEVEKQLKISGKRQIEEFGVAAFNELCRESVHTYIDEFEQMTERLGFWLDMEHPYRTYDSSYIESVWWSLKQLWDKGLLYQDYRVAPYCPRCQTSLSTHELSLGYRDDVPDPSIYVLFADADEDGLNYMAWTTTPWTLPGNVALAVHPDQPYARVRQGGRDIILARARLGILDPGYELVEEMPGRALVGRRYRPLFTENLPEGKAFVVLSAPELVSMEEGTGIVHTAAAYGEADLELCRREGVTVRHTVGLDGRFLDAQHRYAGQFVKDADPHIVADLAGAGRLYRSETITHTYPFCWRCETPLIYYALTSWFIRTTAHRDRLIELNRETGWQPPHIRDGRMGNWLENLQDWNLSRTRYWGTPLPVWICEACDARRCIGSTAELGLTVDADLHRPFIDDITLPCEACGGWMRRVSEVIDCWYDSGAMPFAQWHHPFENRAEFERSHPADFICEAMDQTRGWFFSLLAESALLFDMQAYRNVICLGLVVDSKGKKMSKSLGNVLDPMEAFDEFGADTVRWHFFGSVNPGAEYRITRDTFKEVVRRFILTLWNTYSFFVSYAEVDGFDPDAEAPAAGERPALDRWALARLEQTTAAVREALDRYDATDACRALEDLIADVSRWYVRRSRSRFWREVDGEQRSAVDRADKQAAHATLYTVLLTCARLLAPFMPFLAERIYRNLTGFDGDRAPGPEVAISVHLTDYPVAATGSGDAELLTEMARLRRLVEDGLAARETARLKVRQPLRAATVRGEPLDAELETIFAEELNVRAVRYEPRQGEHEDVTLDTELSDDLRLEGAARELSRAGNALRKQAGLRLDERIDLVVEAPEGGLVARAVEAHRDHLAREVLARSLRLNDRDGRDGPLAEATVRIGGEEVRQLLWR